MNRSLFIFFALVLAGCDGMPGKPKPEARWQPPSAVSDFSTLYKDNCLACHGVGKVVSGSIAMDNPTYLSVVPREVLRRVIEKGIQKTTMPAFSIASGGTLTESQVEILVNGILAKKPTPPRGSPPSYATAPGDIAKGVAAFNTACASCHGATGTGGEKAGSVVDPAYLGLVSNQYLRTIVIAGRPDLGCPDFASRIPGRAMTDEEVADVTAWLLSNRKNEFGQPLVPPALSQP